MKRRISGARLVVSALSLCAMGWMLLPSTAKAQQALVIKLLIERKVTELPAGPLFWRMENFPTVALAQAAKGPTGLVAESGGKVWLFTLDTADGASPGGSKVAEVGPLPNIVATRHGRPPAQYLLRINEASGPPGSITPVLTHPGSEAFYVLAGETSQRTPHGVVRTAVGQSMSGHSADMPMQVSSSGSTDLHALAMFVVDAAKPFSSPAREFQ
jgi:hypothetical protein